MTRRKHGGEALGRFAIKPFELMTEMGFVGKAEFRGNGLIGPTLGDELSGQSTSKLAAPLAGGLAEANGEEAL